MNNKDTNSKIADLQQQLDTSNIDACIISSSDPHGSEYISAHWQCRQWLSGFTGSAGTLVVTKTKAALWTDGRYFIQAEAELKNTNIKIVKQGIADSLDINNWLTKELKPNSTIGLDGTTFSYNTVKNFMALANKQTAFKFNTSIDLTTNIWLDRPKLPANKVFIHDTKFSGKTYKQKISSLRKKLKQLNCNASLITSLDEIAWLVNMRGSDIQHNPVFLSYAFVSLTETIIFANKNIFGKQELKYLQENNILLLEYNAVFEFLKTIDSKHTFFIDNNTTNYTLYTYIKNNYKHESGISPVAELKAIKNNVEIKQMQLCHIEDGIAVVKFMFWLQQELRNNKKVTEITAGDYITATRQKMNNFVTTSFPPIVAYKENGAICHYQATAKSSKVIKGNGLLLIDSGGQYLTGTTDITRAIACSKLTTEEQNDYTLVLKSHIALASFIFPKDTLGIQLDAIARGSLWRNKINFNHGTGHGVGFFLCVHEGPQSISPRYNKTTIKPGMVITNEPGIYRDMKHGVRLENIMLVVKAGDSEFGDFYKLEPLTLAPFDKQAINFAMLDTNEITWLNNYHDKVYRKLNNRLDPETRNWLREQTSKVET